MDSLNLHIKLSTVYGDAQERRGKENVALEIKVLLIIEYWSSYDLVVEVRIKKWIMAVQISQVSCSLYSTCTSRWLFVFICSSSLVYVYTSIALYYLKLYYHNNTQTLYADLSNCVFSSKLLNDSYCKSQIRLLVLYV